MRTPGRITPYGLPGRRIPAGAAARIEPERAALLVNDMQERFLAPFGTMRDTVAGNVATVCACARRTGMLVVFAAQQAQLGGRSPVVAELEPGPGEAVLVKRRYSAFAETPLAEVLGERDQLIVAGVYAHLGVLATALDALERDVLPFVVADAVADLSPAHHAVALRTVAGRGGAVVTTAQMAAELPAPA